MNTIATISATMTNVRGLVVPCEYVYEKGTHCHRVVCVTSVEKRERRTVMISGDLAWVKVVAKFEEYRKQYAA